MQIWHCLQKPDLSRHGVWIMSGLCAQNDSRPVCTSARLWLRILVACPDRIFKRGDKSSGATHVAWSKGRTRDRRRAHQRPQTEAWTCASRQRSTRLVRGRHQIRLGVVSWRAVGYTIFVSAEMFVAECRALAHALACTVSKLTRWSSG